MTAAVLGARGEGPLELTLRRLSWTCNDRRDSSEMQLTRLLLISTRSPGFASSSAALPECHQLLCPLSIMRPLDSDKHDPRARASVAVFGFGLDLRPTRHWCSKESNLSLPSAIMSRLPVVHVRCPDREPCDSQRLHSHFDCLFLPTVRNPLRA